MTRMVLKNTGIGLSILAISAAAGALICCLFGLLGSLLKMPFGSVPIYIIGGIMGGIAALILCSAFIKPIAYFTDKNPNSKNFFLARVNSNKPIKKWQAIISYIPDFVFCLGIIALIIVFNKDIVKMSEVSFVGAATLCGAMGAASLGVPIAGIMGLRTLSFCPHCGAVNSFIYDEDLGFVAAEGISGGAYNYGVSHHGMGWGGGGYDPKKLSNYGGRVSCHCAFCDEKVVRTESLGKMGS